MTRSIACKRLAPPAERRASKIFSTKTVFDSKCWNCPCFPRFEMLELPLLSSISCWLKRFRDFIEESSFYIEESSFSIEESSSVHKCIYINTYIQIYIYKYISGEIRKRQVSRTLYIYLYIYLYNIITGSARSRTTRTGRAGGRGVWQHNSSRCAGKAHKHSLHSLTSV